MSEAKGDSTIKLGYDNWYLWDRHIKSTIRRKNAYIAFDPEPVDPRTQQQLVTLATAASATATPSVTFTPVPTAEELKTYREELKEWKRANNVAAGVILGAISDDVQHIVNPKEPAISMYDKLRAEIVMQSSGSSANRTRLELVYKRFKDNPTMENFEKHLTFYRSKNANLIIVDAGFDDSFLAWLLLNSFNANENPIWSMVSTNIVTSDMPINQWSFSHVAGKLREALRNNIRPAEASVSTSGTNQMTLNAATGKTNQNRYNGPPCTHPGCRIPNCHATENCCTKEREERDKANKKKHRAKRAKKKAIKSDSESESDSEPTQKKRHHANKSRISSEKTLRVLKASLGHTRSCLGEPTTDSNIFIAHPDSGASNHMTHKRELFDSTSFRMLSKPIPISLGDDSEIFATGKGTIRLVFNVDGKKQEEMFTDVLFVPELKVTLLSIGQFARLPHCKVVFDDNLCEYIDKHTNEVIARACVSNDTDLYTLDASPVVQKVVVNLASSPS